MSAGPSYLRHAALRGERMPPRCTGQGEGHPRDGRRAALQKKGDSMCFGAPEFIDSEVPRLRAIGAFVRLLLDPVSG